MEKIQNSKYDLEKRTEDFALEVRKFIKQIEKEIIDCDDARQLLRSSGSIAANYIEANESLIKKDYYLRVKNCRKEAKENCLWLKLISTNQEVEEIKALLIKEATELTRIFGSIITKNEFVFLSLEFNRI